MRLHHAIIVLLFSWTAPIAARAVAEPFVDAARELAGQDGVVLVLGPTGDPVLELNAERAFVPASTLKVVTAYAAMEILGPEYRFTTHFYADDQHVLYVEGHGDPYLVSEEIDLAVQALADRGVVEVAALVLDDSYFEPGLRVPGTFDSDRTYNALNTGLAVNFNCIHVVIDGDEVTAGEEQTPLTPTAVQAARDSGKQGEVYLNVTRDREVALRYAGEIIVDKLGSAGIPVGEVEVRLGAVPEGLEPIYVHANTRDLAGVVGPMLHFSNNFIANQLMLEMGVTRSGAPATVDKGVTAVNELLTRHGLAEGITYVEGSGISRDNRGHARAMIRVLEAFEPHKALLREHHGSMAKGGSLRDTKTLLGFLETAEHGEVRFMVALAGDRWKHRFQLVDLFKEEL